MELFPFSKTLRLPLMFLKSVFKRLRRIKRSTEGSTKFSRRHFFSQAGSCFIYFAQQLFLYCCFVAKRLRIMLSVVIHFAHLLSADFDAGVMFQAGDDVEGFAWSFRPSGCANISTENPMNDSTAVSIISAPPLNACPSLH